MPVQPRWAQVPHPLMQHSIFPPSPSIEHAVHVRDCGTATTSFIRFAVPTSVAPPFSSRSQRQGTTTSARFLTRVRFRPVCDRGDAHSASSDGRGFRGLGFSNSMLGRPSTNAGTTLSCLLDQPKKETWYDPSSRMPSSRAGWYSPPSSAHTSARPSLSILYVRVRGFHSLCVPHSSHLPNTSTRSRPSTRTVLLGRTELRWATTRVSCYGQTIFAKAWRGYIQTSTRKKKTSRTSRHTSPGSCFRGTCDQQERGAFFKGQRGGI